VLERVDRLPQRTILAMASLLVVLLAILDALSGTEARFFIFYWLPIALVAWGVGLRWGYAFVAVSGLAWVLANTFAVQQHWPAWALTTWNATVNMTSFVFLAATIATLRGWMDRERRSARVDFATGVSNARALDEVLATELARARRVRGAVTLAYIDLDDFKRVNDTYGHAAGDAVLLAVANAMKAGLRATDTVCRIGGDEFVLLLPLASADEARHALERLTQSVRELRTVPGLGVSLSVGVVTCTDAQCTEEELIHAADTVMYEVKQEGKGAVRQCILESGQLSPALVAAMR
jgi:diguanylate cyclase (GGDEF)-like protein